MASTIDHQANPHYVSGRRKAYLYLLPLMMGAYFMAFIDRSNLGMAKTELEADIGISAAAYGLGAGIFFISYALLEVPSNLVMHKVGARWWIGRIAVTWGAISSAMMFVQNEWSFYLLRFLLGAAEAGLYPGLLYLITIWFDRRDRPKIVGVLLVASSLAFVLGSPIGGALMLMDGIGGLHGWQWLFLLEGLPSVAIGIWIWFVLPNRPSEAKWLTKDEAEAMEAAAGDEGTEAHLSGGLKVGFSNPIILLVAGVYFLNQIATYGAVYFIPSAIQGMGVTNTFEIGALAGVVGLGAALGAFFYPRINKREGAEVQMMTIALIGASIGAVAFLTVEQPFVKLLCLAFAMFFTNGIQPMFWSIAMARISGRIAAAVLALINTIGLFGGFFGPYMFGIAEDVLDSAEGGFWVFLASLIVSLVVIPFVAAARRKAPLNTDAEEEPVGV